MFKGVHHVTYVVEDVQKIVDYIERNFGMKPQKVSELPDRGYKMALYQVGPTIVDFFQPIREDTNIARTLREKGPGVLHVAWEVEGIDKVARDLVAKGNNLTGGNRPTTSPLGYRTVNIEPSGSYGIIFQLAEGKMAQ